MSNSSSLTSVVAKRYAGSLFDLAVEDKCVDAVEQELISVSKLIDKNQDVQRLIFSPVFSRDEQIKAISALCDAAGLKAKGAKLLVGNFLKVIAGHRRLFALPGIIGAFHQRAAQSRGEISAEVISAHALTSAQEKELKTVLKNVAGKDVRLHVTVDSAILGGLIVRLGSRQIDTSLLTKLSSLKLALKEVG